MQGYSILVFVQNKTKNTPSGENSVFPCPVLNNMQARKAVGKMYPPVNVVREITYHFFLLHIPEAVFSWESTCSMLFQKLKCLWPIAPAVVSVSIPLCCTFWAFAPVCFTGRKAQDWSEKAQTF